MSIPAQRDEFVKDWIYRSRVLCGETKTQEDVLTAWAEVRIEEEYKRGKRKLKMTKEEFRAEYWQDCQDMGLIPTEEKINQIWDATEFNRRLLSIRGRNLKETIKKKNAFLEQWEKEQERKRCDSSTEKE